MQKCFRSLFILLHFHVLRFCSICSFVCCFAYSVSLLRFATLIYVKTFTLTSCCALSISWNIIFEHLTLNTSGNRMTYMCWVLVIQLKSWCLCEFWSEHMLSRKIFKHSTFPKPMRDTHKKWTQNQKNNKQPNIIYFQLKIIEQTKQTSAYKSNVNEEGFKRIDRLDCCKSGENQASNDQT